MFHILHMDPVTFKMESVKIPESIGAFRMKRWEMKKDNSWVGDYIPKIDCKRQFDEKLSD